MQNKWFNIEIMGTTIKDLFFILLNLICSHEIHQIHSIQKKVERFLGIWLKSLGRFDRLEK